MYIIRKDFHFSASHTLEGLEDGHPCMRMHGHNYVATFEFRSATLNDQGFVIDYRKLQPIKDSIDALLDHHHLNWRMDGQPSAERIAHWLFINWKGTFPELYAVEIKETDKTCARYEE